MGTDFRARRVLVTGGSGFLGKPLLEVLRERGYRDVVAPSHADYDLTEQDQVRRMFADVRPAAVIHLAGLVGGIMVNKERPGDFFYQNLAMGTLVQHEAWRAGAEKFMTCIGGCSYPGDAPSPIGEDTLFQGYPQAESAPYALAKAMSVVQAQAYRQQYGFNSVVLVPGNMYGPYDHFDLQNSHVIAALTRKFVEAVESGATSVEVWGSGRPTRDFVYVDDVARVLVQALEEYDGAEIANISSGTQVSIRELAETLRDITGFTGDLVFDASKPDGQLFKGFDVTRMRELLHASCDTSLRDGLAKTVEWFKASQAAGAVRL
ncbi:MAG: GDP-L-fucose synthase [Dehalococcoidia bacterium]